MMTAARMQRADTRLRGRAGELWELEDEILFTIAKSPIGLALAARSSVGLCAVLLGDDRVSLERELRARFGERTEPDGGAEMHALMEAVTGLIAAPAQPFQHRLDLRGTPFQLAVWNTLATIPAGQTETYGTIAGRIGRPNSARAVGAACAANALAVVIPCHRAVHRDGSLAGYRWGVERKRRLIGREGQG